MTTHTLPAPPSIRASICSDIELKVASSRHERQLAFELVYNSYLRAGLCESNACGMRATEYQLLPTTDVFTATLQGEVISTVSLVRNGQLGLPMEQIFPDIISQRRADGRKIAEVSCLADRRSDPGRFFKLFCELGRLMAQLAIKQGIDELLVAVHPRHSAIYRRFMAFRPLGDRRDYPMVCGSPAVPLVLNFADAQANSPAAWQHFFGEHLPDEVLQACPLSEADAEYFRSVMAVPTDSVPFAATGEEWRPHAPVAAQLLCA
jgi:hypothetical protein